MRISEIFSRSLHPDDPIEIDHEPSIVIAEDLVLKRADLQVYKNPSKTEVTQLYSNCESSDRRLRVLVGDIDIFVWDAWYDTHAGVMLSLKLEAPLVGLIVYNDRGVELADFNLWKGSGWSEQSDSAILEFVMSQPQMRKSFGFRLHPAT